MPRIARRGPLDVHTQTAPHVQHRDPAAPNERICRCADQRVRWGHPDKAAAITRNHSTHQRRYYVQKRCETVDKSCSKPALTFESSNCDLELKHAKNASACTLHAFGARGKNAGTHNSAGALIMTAKCVGRLCERGSRWDTTRRWLAQGGRYADRRNFSIPLCFWELDAFFRPLVS